MRYRRQWSATICQTTASYPRYGVAIA